MKVEFEIDDDLIPTMKAIFSRRTFPLDDGLSEVLIMEECNIDPKTYVRAEQALFMLIDNLKEN